MTKITFGTREVEFSELKASDLKEFGRWLHEQGIEPEGKFWKFDELMGHVEEVDSLLWLGWRSASRCQSITINELAELVPLVRLAEIADALVSMNGAEREEPTEGN